MFSRIVKRMHFVVNCEKIKIASVRTFVNNKCRDEWIRSGSHRKYTRQTKITRTTVHNKLLSWPISSPFFWKWILSPHSQLILVIIIIIIMQLYYNWWESAMKRENFVEVRKKAIILAPHNSLKMFYLSTGKQVWNLSIQWSTSTSK
jgi:hypothetical protein